MKVKSALPAGALAAAIVLAGGLGAGQKLKPEFVLQDKIRRPEPFAQSRLQINPPTFRWPAASGASAHRVELSQDPSFNQARRETVSELFYRPLAPLETGTWHWRYRVEAPRQGSWSATESFVISEDLPRREVPDWKRLLDRVPTSHPRIYLRREELSQLRAKARGLAGNLEKWKERIRRSAERPYLLESYEAQVPSGADHGFTDHQVKKKLVWAAKAAGNDAAQPVGNLAWIWLATGDRWFLDAAKSRAVLAARLDPKGFVSAKNSDFGNAAIVYNLGLAYDLLYDELSGEEREIIRRSIVARAAPIFKDLQRSSQNLMRAHGWQHIYLDGMTGALAVYGEEPAASGWVELGLKSFVALYPWFGGNDGGSQEGTRYYYGPELIASLNVRDVFHNAFGLDLEEVNPWFRANPFYLIYSFPPGGTLAKLGDSVTGSDEEEKFAPGGKGRLVASRMAGLYNNGYAAAYAALLPDDDAGYSISEYLRWHSPVTVKPESLEQMPAARLFSDIGAVFTHSDYTRQQENVRLVFHAGPYGALGHAHADQNSFHIIAYNEDLLLDSGYYTPTGDPHRQEWTVQTRAHNTILVDGVGQPYGDNTGHGRIRHFEQNSDWVYMVGSAETAYREVDLDLFDRHIVWLKGKEVQSYVLVDDIRAAQGRHRFDWLLHASRQMQVEDSRRRVTVRGAEGEALVSFLEPQELRFQQDDKFDVPAVYWRNDDSYPLPNQWHLQVTPPAAPGARFVAVIQVSKPGAAKPAIHALEAGAEVAGWRVQLRPESRLLRISKKN